MLLVQNLILSAVTENEGSAIDGMDHSSAKTRGFSILDCPSSDDDDEEEEAGDAPHHPASSPASPDLAVGRRVGYKGPLATSAHYTQDELPRLLENNDGGAGGGPKRQRADGDASTQGSDVSVIRADAERVEEQEHIGTQPSLDPSIVVRQRKVSLSPSKQSPKNPPQPVPTSPPVPSSPSSLSSSSSLPSSLSSSSSLPSARFKLLCSLNYPGHLWRVMSSERVVIDNGGGTTVEIVPGLYRLGDEGEAHNFNASLYREHGGRKKMVSFRVHTGDQQGTYLRHCGRDLRAHHQESSALYRLDATFYMEEDRFFPGTVSFHSINYDKHYISHRSYCLKIATISKGKQELHRKDASFTITDAGADAGA